MNSNASSPSLGYVDFIRVLGLRALARNHIPWAQSAFLQRAWLFLGRSSNLVFATPDEPTLESALRQAASLAANIPQHLHRLNKEHLHGQSTESLQLTLEQWGFDSPREHKLYLSGLPSLKESTPEFTVQVASGVRLDAKWCCQHVGKRFAEVTLWVESGTWYQDAVHGLCSLHGSQTSYFESVGPHTPCLMFQGSASLMHHRSRSAEAVVVWTDYLAFTRAVSVYQQVAKVTVQVSPGTYSPRLLILHPHIHLTGGGAGPSAVTLATPGGVSICLGGGSRHQGAPKMTDMEVSNLRFVAADSKAMHVSMVPHRSKMKRRHRANSELQLLRSRLRNMQLDSQTVNSLVSLAETSAGDILAQPDADVHVKAKKVWMHHCCVQGGLVGIHIQVHDSDAVIEHCEVQYAVHAGIFARGTTFIAHNTLDNNGSGVHILRGGSSLAPSTLKANRIQSLTADWVDEGGHMQAPEALQTGIIITRASVEMSLNIISGCHTGVFICEHGEATFNEKVHAMSSSASPTQDVPISMQENLIENSVGAGILVHAPFRWILVKNNTLRQNGWGVLCRSVCGKSLLQASVPQPKIPGTLSLVGNLITGSSHSAIVVTGGGFGGRVSVEVQDNHIEGNRAGVMISGTALQRSLDNMRGYPYNARIRGNTITNSDTAAIVLERGAAAHLIKNIVARNGRGVSVQDFASSACCAKVEENVFEENNGWALRFSFMAYVGRSQQAQEAALQLELHGVPAERRRDVLVSRITPKLVAASRGSSRGPQLALGRLSAMPLDDLVKVSTDHESFRDFLAKHGFRWGSVPSYTNRHSLVWHNCFIESERSFGRGAWSCRIDTNIQSPHLVGNVNQHGAEVTPLLSRPDVCVSYAQPSWSFPGAMPDFTQQPPRGIFGLRSGFGRFYGDSDNSDDLGW